MTNEIYSIQPLIAIAIPAVAAVVVVAIGDRNEKLRNLISVLAAVVTFGVVLAIVIKVLGGNPLYFEFRLIEVGHQFSLNLMVDSMGAFFALIASILWVAAMAYSSAYMFHQQKRTRFFTFMMITEAATLGIFMVHDFLSLFVFFELMSLAAYVLVIHSETEGARSAANKYLYMMVIGGLSLFMGILLYFSYSGTVDFIPPAGSAFLTGPFKTAALACMIAGFGVKAGIVPLHVWLPDAHPVAPSPASALLSGVMIKAGAYGILRTVTGFFYLPASHEAETVINNGSSLSQNVQSLGFAIIWIAVVSMFIGVVLALTQDNIKRMLAYHSISQMGFILLGIGCLAYSGGEGAFGLAGSLYHIINHALFKACLFMAAGSILYCTHELNMFKLGGLWRKMPLTTLLWCVAALGIMGIPLFNGFVSKSLLHHAIVEAQYLATQGALFQAAWLKAAEILFIIISAGTILSFLKMTYYAFFRSPSEENAHRLEKVKEAPGWMLGGIGMLAIGVLVAGVVPGFFLQRLIIPVAEMFRGLDPQGVEQLGNLAIFSWANIKEVLLPLALGGGVFVIGASWGLLTNRAKKPYLLHFRLPHWFSVDYWYMQGAKRAIRYADLVSAKFAPLVREYSGDIALGALVIAGSLVIFLVVTLL